MELPVIAMLGLAACMHSTWNLFAKKSLDKQVFLWLSLTVGSAIFFVPFIFVFRPLTSTGWLYVFISGAAESVYYLLLGSAYQKADLSLVYPVARGSAPLFVTAGASLFLGETVPAVGIAGILFIVTGVYILHLRSLDRRGVLGPLFALRETGSRLALLTGVAIAIYSIIDKAGVKHVHPVPYIYLVFITAVVLLSPYMLTVRRQAVALEWSANFRSIVLVAVMNVATYLLVLFAMTLSKVSYVASVREMSVVIGAALGTFVLNEPFGRQKILGALFIFFGVFCIGLAH